MAETSTASGVDGQPTKKRGPLADIQGHLSQRARPQEHVSRNVNDLQDEQLTFGQRLADRVADLVGSWGFIGSTMVLVALWIFVNSFLLIERPWDPYPFILLNLVLSMAAGLQGPVIMMSQNRQEAKDRLRAQQDYDVNLKAEVEIEELHAKLDVLREGQWKDLVEMQQRQIKMLEQQIELLQSLTKPPVAATREA